MENSSFNHELQARKAELLEKIKKGTVEQDVIDELGEINEKEKVAIKARQSAINTVIELMKKSAVEVVDLITLNGRLRPSIEEIFTKTEVLAEAARYSTDLKKSTSKKNLRTQTQQNTARKGGLGLAVLIAVSVRAIWGSLQTRAFPKPPR